MEAERVPENHYMNINASQHMHSCCFKCTHTHTLVHTHAHTHNHRHTCAHVPKHRHKHTHTQIHLNQTAFKKAYFTLKTIDKPNYTHIHTHTHIRIHTHAYTPTHTHIHAHLHTHTHTICVWLKKCHWRISTQAVSKLLHEHSTYFQ